MTDEEVRKAASAAWDADRGDGSVFSDATKDMSESSICAMVAVYRAGMEAGRTEAAAKPKRRKADPCTVERPDCVESQTWDDWLALRKAKKAAVTKTVLNAAWREAAKAEISLEAFLQVWCFRGSQGLEAAWLTPAERGRGPQAGRMDRQLETAALMTGATRSAPTDMGEIYDVGQQRIAGR